MVRSFDLFGGQGLGQFPKPNTPVSPAYKQADIVNKEGFTAFSRTIEEDTLSVLMTNTLSNTFYVSQKELAKETKDVLSAMAKKDPEFLAKAVAYARTKGLMRLAPVLGLTILSAEDGKAAKDAFRKAFRHVIQIPDDLREFVALCRTANIRQGKRIKVLTKKQGDRYKVVGHKVLENGVGGLGGVAHECVQNYLRHLPEYHAIKYGSKNSEGITLKDIVKMAHPSPRTKSDLQDLEHERLRNGAQRELFGWLVNGWKEIGDVPSPTNPQIWAFEKLKRAASQKEIISLIKEYRLPKEAVIPALHKTSTAIWMAIIKDMPYMATLKELNTMNRHGAFEDPEIVDLVAKRLSDPRNVERSKQFPFAFTNAMDYFEGHQQKIREALVDALEASFVNMPEIPGRTCVANDISNSMSMTVSNKAKARACDVAGIFAAAVFKKCEDSVIVPFDDSAHPEYGRVSKRDSVMSIAKQISRLDGGTNLGAPVEYMMRTNQKVDTFVVMTDNEDWAGKGFLSYFEQYKRQINPKAKAFCVRLASYQDYVAPRGYPDVHFIQGWSPRILSYIPLILNRGGSQVDEVRKFDLDAFRKPKKVVVETESESEED